MDRIDAPRKGILFAVAGIFVLSIQDVAIKSISGAYPVHEIVFIRSLFAIPPILLLAHLEGGLTLLRTRQPWLQLARACAMFAAYTLYYLALAALPLADTVALTNSAPLFVTALSVPLLGERVGIRRWLAVLLGFLGVVVMMQPGASVFDPAAALAVSAALCYALSAVTARRLGGTDSASSMAFYPTVFYLAAGGVVGLTIGNGAFETGGHASLQFLLRAWAFPPWQDLTLIALCGLFAALAFYALSQAYRIAPATTVAPFEYVSVPFSVVLGFLVWQEFPGTHTLAGMALVVGSGLYVLRRESSPARTESASD
jgi:drug/metabolite transporter (DMT)-like permease